MKKNITLCFKLKYINIIGNTTEEDQQNYVSTTKY